MNTLMHHRPPPPVAGPLWKTAIVAGAAAAAVNAAVFAASVPAGVFPRLEWAPAGPGMGLMPVVAGSFVAALAAAAVYAVLRRATAHAWRPFLGIAAVVLAASFAAPLALAGLTREQVILLDVLHVTTAVVAVALLRRWTHRREAAPVLRRA